MRRTFVALLFVVSACSGSDSTAPTAHPPYMSLPGSWSLQTLASDSCSGLPADARSRSYSIINIYQTGYDTISINVALNGVSTPIMNASYSGLKIQDKLRLVDNSAVGRLVIDGTFTSSVVSQDKITGRLNGNFTTATADCVASDHTLTFTR
jgi:hypothetical protein